MFKAHRIRDLQELDLIISMQRAYLRGQGTIDEEIEQGFLTVSHSREMLWQMHLQEPSIIVMQGDALAGYALVMTKSCRKLIPILVPMFEVFDDLYYENRPVNDYHFYIMGQICVDKPYRSMGAFDLLYGAHYELLSPLYDFVITEISTRNFRSLRAHERVGFRPFHTYRDETDEWAIVIWDWKSTR
jgi:hypothetical protein